MTQAQPSERVAVVGTVDPVDVNNVASGTDAVDMSKYRSAMFIALTGAMAASSTLDLKLQESILGTSTWVDLTGKAATQLVNTDDNKQVVLNVKAEELSAGYRYTRCLQTPSAHSIIAAVVALGLDPVYGPGSDGDLSSVAQIVT